MAAVSLPLRAVSALSGGLAQSVSRALHVSPAVCRKNMLKKFASKTRKKFWYESPSLGPHLAYKPSQLDILTKNIAKKTRKEDHVRLRALNGLIFKALTDMLSTPEVSQELYDLNVELSKVSLTSDFSICRVYWKTSLVTEQNRSTEAVLKRSATQMRHLLMSLQILRNAPPLVFVQDRENAAIAEVDQLLAIADFGPKEKEEEEEEEKDRDAAAQEERPPKIPEPCASLSPPVSWSLCGINHEALNQQIMEYKRRKQKGCAGESTPSPEQLALLRRQVGWRRKKAKTHLDTDLSPKSTLWEPEDEDDLEEGAEQLGLGCEEELPTRCEQAGPEAEPGTHSLGRRDRGD